MERANRKRSLLRYFRTAPKTAESTSAGHCALGFRSTLFRLRNSLGLSPYIKASSSAGSGTCRAAWESPMGPLLLSPGGSVIPSKRGGALFIRTLRVPSDRPLLVGGYMFAFLLFAPPFPCRLVPRRLPATCIRRGNIVLVSRLPLPGRLFFYLREEEWLMAIELGGDCSFILCLRGRLASTDSGNTSS